MLFALVCASALIVWLNVVVVVLWSRSVKATLQTQKVEGVVVGASRTWSETHVSGSSSGGGGYIYPHTGGSIASPDVKISSNVSTWHQFFVRGEDGFERAVTIPSGTDFPTRDGHRVVLVFLVCKRSKWFLWAIRNRQTGLEYWFSAREFLDGQGPWLLRAHLNALLFLLLGGILTFAGVYATPSVPLRFLLGFIAWCFAAWVSFWPRWRAASKIMSQQRRAPGVL